MVYRIKYMAETFGSTPLHLETALIYLYCTASSVGGQLDSWLHPLNLNKLKEFYKKLNPTDIYNTTQHNSTEFMFGVSSTACIRINC